VFFGTPEWAVPSLAALIDSDIEVVGVVTNPDKASGRGLKDRTAPVKAAALTAGIPVMQPERMRDPDWQERFAALGVDIACVVAYGKLLPNDLLAIPPLGFVNAHFSLLPAYRGAAPVQWALMNGDEVTGVSIMLLSEGMDEGPILDAERVAIDPADSAATLGPRLAGIAGPLLLSTVRRYAEGHLVPTPQPTEGVSLAPKLTAADVRVDWSRTATDIHNLIRGAHPEPGAWTTFRGRRMKLLGSSVLEGAPATPQGQVELTAGGLLVGCGEGVLLVTRAQLQGKRSLPAIELGRGLHLVGGERFG
jgi:methionyl-tRNA formyltransferase